MEEQGLFTIHWARCCRGQAEASNIWLGSPMLAIDSWYFESIPTDMLPTHFEPSRIEPRNSEPADFRTEPNRISNFDSNWGASHGLTAHFAARGGSAIRALFVAPWPCQSCLPGKGSTGEPTVVTCPCFWRPQLSSGRLGAARPMQRLRSCSAPFAMPQWVWHFVCSLQELQSSLRAHIPAVFPAYAL